MSSRDTIVSAGFFPLSYNERSKLDSLSTCSSTFRRTCRVARPCRPSSVRAAIWLALLLSGARSAVAADRPPLIASRDDAFVAHQNGSDVWSIGSANLELVVGFDASRTLTLQQLFNPVTGRAWDITP